MSEPILIECGGCRTIGAVNRLTAGLRCTCGSDDLDFYEPPFPTFLEVMGAAHGPGTGWGSSMPDPLKGWSQYAGPMPGPNTRTAPTRHGPPGCENCRGSKVDIKDGGICRACKGTGHRTPPTAVSPEPLVARHPGQTSVPFMGRRKKPAKRQATRGDHVARMAAAVREQNPGLGENEIQQIVTYTVQRYGSR